MWTRRTLTQRYRPSLDSDSLSKQLDAWLSSGGWLIKNPLWTWVQVDADANSRTIRLDSNAPGIGSVVFRWTLGSDAIVYCHLRFDPFSAIGLVYWLVLWPGHWVGLWVLMRLVFFKAKAMDHVG